MLQLHLKCAQRQLPLLLKPQWRLPFKSLRAGKVRRPFAWSGFSRAPLQASTARNPAQRGAIIGVAFFASFFGEGKTVTRPLGRTPGLSPRQCRHVASPGKAQVALSVLSFKLF
jgi:hypothetical protein